MRTFFAVVALVSAVAPTAGADPTYWQDMRPLLRKHCTVCHNEKNLKEADVSGGLALDSYDAILKRKTVVTAGKSVDSRLVKLLVSTDENRRMPQGAPALPEEIVSVFRRWIDSGAKEGTRPDTTTTEVNPSTPPPRTRKLDVILPTAAVPPAGLLGPGAASKLELALKVGPLSPVATVTFSPDGKLLATGSYGLVTVWSLEKVEPIKTLTNVLGAVNCLRFSPDGKILAVAGGQPSAKGEVRLFATADWKLLGTLAGHADVVAGLSFRADGQKLASASFDKTVRVWDVTSHKLEQVHSGHSDFVYAVAFSPDGTLLASATRNRRC